MNRFLYVALVTFITIACFSMYINHDLGTISIAFADFAFETNFLVFGAAMLSALFAVLLLHRSFLLLKSLFHYLFGQRQQRLKSKAQSLLKQGLIEYTEGQYNKAEKTLLQLITHSDNPVLAYLTAAKSAQQQGALERRDDYLRKALQCSPETDAAIGITQARLQLEQKQNEQALATLQQLHSKYPYHSYVLQLLAATYRKLEDWDNLDRLLPDLKKHSQLSADTILDYQTAICHGQLGRISAQKDASALTEYWQQTSKTIQTMPVLIEHYARCLISLDKSTEAEEILRQYLSTHWHDSSIQLYSELDLVIDNKLLDNIETWLSEHKNNPYLLLALGKACLNLSLWGKAKNYLDASISIKAMPESCLIIARLLEDKMDSAEAAAEYYRQGLFLLAGKSSKDFINCSNSQTEIPKLKIVKKNG